MINIYEWSSDDLLNSITGDRDENVLPIVTTMLNQVQQFSYNSNLP